MHPIKQLKLFVSSPGDVLAERERVERVVGVINGDYLGLLEIEVIRWETRFYSAHLSFQPQIIEATDCDLVIGILRSRLGTPLPPGSPLRANGVGYESGTVYELETAIDAQSTHESPQVYVFRSSAPARFDADQLLEQQQQLAALEAFWQRTFVDTHGHFLRAFQSYADAPDFETKLESCVRQWLTKQGHLLDQPLWNVAVSGSPFRGLEAFDESHQRVFFGRRQALDSCWQRLLEARDHRAAFLLILGGSGVGKSSLVRSGLIPRFKLTLNARGFDRARSASCKPGLQPLKGLEEGLRDAFTDWPVQGSIVEGVMHALECADSSLQLEPVRLRNNQVMLLLVVDQLEEVLNAPDDEVLAFAHALGALLDTGRVYLVATFRTDRYSALTANAPLAALKDRAVCFDLVSPNAAELDEIVRGPARAAELKFELDIARNLDLADYLLADVRGNDALALLQLTLAQLFDNRDGNLLKLDTYRAIGGVRGAVINAAEVAYAQLSAQAKSCLPGVIAELTAGFGDSGEALARPIARPDADQSARSELIETLARNRLLIVEEGSVRVAHEALLRNWPRAVEYLLGIHDTIEIRERLRTNSIEWQRHQSEQYLLAAGPLLSSAAVIASGPHAALLPPLERDFIRASLDADRRVRSVRTRRLTLIAASMSVLAVLAIVAALFAFQQRASARSSFSAAVSAVDGLSRDIARSLKAARGISAETVETVLKQARTLVERIAQADPNNPNLQKSQIGMLLGFADTYRSVARSVDADAALTEAIALLDLAELAFSSDPLLKRYRIEAELGLSQKGFFELDLKAARRHAERADVLAKTLPDAEELRLRATRSLGSALYLDGELGASVAALQATVGASAAQSSVDSAIQIAAIGNIYGDASLDLNRPDDARRAFERARELGDLTRKREPNSAELSEVQLRSRRGLARVALSGGDRAAAREQVDTAISMGDELVAANPNSAMVTLALQGLLSFSATLSEQSNDRAAQLKALGRAVDLMAQSAARDSRNLFIQAEFAFALRRLGEVQLLKRDLDSAEVSLNRALALDRRLLESNPQRPFARRYLAATLEQIGRLRMHQKSFDLSFAAHQEALAIRQALVSEFPKEPLWLGFVAISQFQLGRLLFAQLRLPEALAQQQIAEATFAETAHLSATVAARKDWLDACYETVTLMAEMQRYDDAVQHLRLARSNALGGNGAPNLSADYRVLFDRTEALLLATIKTGKAPG